MIWDQVQSLNYEYDVNKAGILDGGDDFDASNCNEDTDDTEEDAYGKDADDNDDDDDKDDDEDTEANEDLSAQRIPRPNPAPERRTQLHLRRRPSSDGNICFVIILVSIIIINSYWCLYKWW